ncbi:Sugar kinase of the NBD/HSP70 family, may contain an N-terminal HTH domain [Rhodococcus triatomae]|uniref:Sugar kinase of the NBD/HSP70 family, may contain an N-terminal HTH domain n=1 Tax=Rhodococcus triatomae TaxID=300028 RepID=A0A1G8GAQ7_9NOCA|nr:ROK family protein [Rhodococcus triatomae]SDH91360.1 Sugar kinase of the NBD/HSP70 family, may contain an N-terminal HTH domain [Rhodococcus triatomae]
MTGLPTVAVDLGGTWLRIRGADGTCRVPAPSALRHPGVPVEELVERLLDALCSRVPTGSRVAVSCGAAMDEERKEIHGSGPLWGSGIERPIRLVDLLSERRPDSEWHLVNDVTAALADFVRRHARPGHRKVCYLTVSSGIALRTADVRTHTIPVDGAGLQGEVGHLRAVTSGPAAVQSLPCPCGGRGHVSSIAAGPALDGVARALGTGRTETLREELEARVRGGDDAAIRLWTLVVEPIAELVRTVWSLDPQIDLIGIGGGFVEARTALYRDELFRQVATVRSYADRGLDVEHLGDRLHVCEPGDVDPLDGVVAMADGALTVSKI